MPAALPWPRVAERLRAKLGAAPATPLLFAYRDAEGDLIDVEDEEDYQVARLETGDRLEFLVDEL